MWFMEEWGKMAEMENLKHDNQRMEKALEEIRSFTAYTVGSGIGVDPDFSPKLMHIYLVACRALRKDPRWTSGEE